ncbi:unnamed protein product [Schistosoma rodhaini]|uniref:EGF-like domain-containing protein n=1 Tax=Schistosoma rodhaini TaxID=6188 RepID=A0AA85G0A0_9TREM|nr:unnamed protein product [Schistosoma rodhaini]CAH8600799.1 unnamed protein product [Schistosoma rodhaini]
MMLLHYKLHWYHLLLCIVQTGLLTNAKPYHVSYEPDETIIKPCRSGTAHCMFGDCTKIWLRKKKHVDIIIECQCWTGYSGEWCNIYPPEHKHWEGLLRTKGKDEITPVINTKQTPLTITDIWHEQSLQYAGYLVDKHRESIADRLKNKFLVFHNSLSPNHENNNRSSDK